MKNKPSQIKPIVPNWTPEDIKRLREEGAAFRKEIEKRAAKMRQITAEDLSRRCQWSKIRKSFSSKNSTD